MQNSLNLRWTHYFSVIWLKVSIYQKFSWMSFYIASISAEHQYTPPLYKLSVLHSADSESPTKWQIFQVHDTLHLMSTGLHQLPAWLLGLGSPLATSSIPQQWKQVSICPVNKLPVEKTLSNFQPISINPVLTGVIERIVVRDYIYPALPNPSSSPLFYWSVCLSSIWFNYGCLQTMPRVYKLCLVVFKCQQEAPTYLSSLCLLLSAVTTHRQLRAATQGDLNYLRTRTVIRLMGICSFWNLIPSSLKSPSLKPAHFCKQLF